jgi:hypothetical protein
VWRELRPIRFNKLKFPTTVVMQLTKNRKKENIGAQVGLLIL